MIGRSRSSRWPDQAGLAGHRQPGPGQLAAQRWASGAARHAVVRRRWAGAPASVAGGPRRRAIVAATRSRLGLAEQPGRVRHLQQQRGEGLVDPGRRGPAGAGPARRGRRCAAPAPARRPARPAAPRCAGPPPSPARRRPSRRRFGSRGRGCSARAAAGAAARAGRCRGAAAARPRGAARPRRSRRPGAAGAGVAEQAVRPAPAVGLDQPAHRVVAAASPAVRGRRERADRRAGGEPVEHRPGGRRRGQQGAAQPGRVRAEGRRGRVQVRGRSAQAGRVRRADLVDAADDVQSASSGPYSRNSARSRRARPGRAVGVRAVCRAHGHGEHRVDGGQRRRPSRGSAGPRRGSGG